MHRSPDDRNPGNNLYVTGLSTRVTEDDLEKFFNKEGKVWCQIISSHILIMMVSWGVLECMAGASLLRRCFFS